MQVYLGAYCREAEEGEEAGQVGLEGGAGEVEGGGQGYFKGLGLSGSSS